MTRHRIDHGTGEKTELGNLAREMDARGRTTYYEYDAAGNRTKEYNRGDSVYYYYDDANELTNRVVAGGEQTYYAYDENGSMATEHCQVAAETTYFEYADNGLVSRTHRGGIILRPQAVARAAAGSSLDFPSSTCFNSTGEKVVQTSLSGRARLGAALLAFGAALPGFAGIIPPERRIVWEPGVPGGIPEVPQGCSVRDFGAVGDGLTDDASAFEAAINSTESGRAVLIPEGTYLIKSFLTIDRGVVLRGEGPGKSSLVFDFDGAPAVDALQIAKYDSGGWVDVTGGYTKLSTALSVADASSFNPGDFIELQQENDPAVMYTQAQWNVPWAQESVGEIFRLVSVGSGSIALDRAVHLDYRAGLNPQARRVGLVLNAGVERLHLKRLDAGDGHIICIKNAAYCWVRDVESEYACRSHLDLECAYRCEIRDSYIHHAHDYGSGHGCGVNCHRHVTDCLVENNIFVHLRHSMMVQVGANGNVFGYNYSEDPYQSEGGTWTPCDISGDGHYPFMNLFEGNTVQEVDVSDYWGPCGPGNTFFRNRLKSEGVEVMDCSHRQNIVGNELGSGENVISIQANVEETLVHGNYLDGAISWDDAIADHDLPDSYYLASRPHFFGGLRWPVTGADLAPDGGMIPAELRWRGEEVPPADSGGGGGGCGAGAAGLAAVLVLLRAFAGGRKGSDPWPR